MKAKSTGFRPITLCLLTWLLILGSVPANAALTLVWSDEFNNFNNANWTHQTGDGCAYGICGWGNNELQQYRASNSSIVSEAGADGTALRIQMTREGNQLFSSRLVTQGKRSFRRGRIEARIKRPYGPGLWPAFWMLGTQGGTWPAIGEIDIMEQRNSEGSNHGTIHWQDHNGLYANYSGSTPLDGRQWHVYTLDWDHEFLRWSVDGVEYHAADIRNAVNGTNEFQDWEHYILLNFAAGSSATGFTLGQSAEATAMPQNMYVDWVRVYQDSNVPGTSCTGCDTVTNPGGPAGYTFCANENGTCSFSGSASVAYGANGVFVYRSASNGIACNNATFGDPAPGVAKACYFQPGGNLVTLYQDCNYAGYSAGFGEGDFDLSALQAAGVANDDLSSLSVAPGYQVTLYEHAGFGGASITLSGDDACLTDNSAGGLNFNDEVSSMRVTADSSPPVAEVCAAYEAEDYVAFFDTTAGNEGGQYRNDDVDIEATADSGGGHNVGWIDTTEWLAFNSLTIPSSGTYTIKLRVASDQSGGQASIDLNGGNIVLGTIDIPYTGGWQNWTTVSTTVNINAGTYSLGVFAAVGGWNLNWIEIEGAGCSGGVSPGGPGVAGATNKRLKIISACPTQPMWIQWLTAPGIQFNAPNRHRLSTAGDYIEYDIPDVGLAAMRFWPGFGCDANGHNCTIGASGGPAELGFTCPPEGCAPPIDSKFEITFACIDGVSEGDCFQNPSAPGQALGRNDWWNSSVVDGFTAPMKVQVKGNCPVGPQPDGPGGPPGGLIDCSQLTWSSCPTNENLSSNGQYPGLSNVDLRVFNPATGAQAGCYSPSGKLGFSHWAGGFQTYPTTDPHLLMYACPTPPISPEQCSNGPAHFTQYRSNVHAKCDTYTYPYDDGVGLSSCPGATNLSYEITFYCPG